MRQPKIKLTISIQCSESTQKTQILEQLRLAEWLPPERPFNMVSKSDVDIEATEALSVYESMIAFAVLQFLIGKSDGVFKLTGLCFEMTLKDFRDVLSDLKIKPTYVHAINAIYEVAYGIPERPQEEFSEIGNQGLEDSEIESGDTFENEFTFLCVGKPLAQPRPRATVGKNGKPHIYHPDGDVAKWRQTVKTSCLRSFAQSPGGQITRACVVAIEFKIPRPGSHFGPPVDDFTPLANFAPTDHEDSPDLDNLAKPILDAMKDSGVLKDDSIVIQLNCRKTWCRYSGSATVTVYYNK